ncbi:uncharacterized protein LOC111466208 [Cucurbita maxima]|uniref:Uncharacterized protein LOC111466208 n=1 Tax=Cucurbita maxima TaxID=3661 RepID=A0A6J1HU63_CUCMA|nr:uncharacterized protein LOC111466208 [Cucurbita maxima]
MSTNPNVSPPKNFFPFSSSSNALNASPASATASSFSFPCLLLAFTHIYIKSAYLVIHEVGPEQSQSFLIGIVRQKGVFLPSLVNVLKDNNGLCNGLAGMDEGGHLLVNRVIF